MRRLLPLLAAALVGAIVAATGASAATTSSITVVGPRGWPVSVHVGSQAKFDGAIKPDHPDDTKVRLDELVSGSWRVIKKGPTIRGDSFTIYTPTLKTYKRHVYRVCVLAISHFAKACSWRLLVVAGRWITASSLTPTAHTGPFSVGVLTIGGVAYKHSLRWPGSAASGSVTYNVHDKCGGGHAGIGSEDHAISGSARYSVFMDGERITNGTLPAGIEQSASLNMWGKSVFKFAVGYADDGVSGPGTKPSERYGFPGTKAFCAIPP